MNRVISAKEAEQRTYYKTEKGIIIEVNPNASDKKYEIKISPDCVKYRRKTPHGFYIYGWLQANYKLYILTEEEKLSMLKNQEETIAQKTNIKTPKVIKEDKSKKFNLSNWFKANINKTNEDMLSELKLMQERGDLALKRPLHTVIKQYRSYFARKQS